MAHPAEMSRKPKRELNFSLLSNGNSLLQVFDKNKLVLLAYLFFTIFTTSFYRMERKKWKIELLKNAGEEKQSVVFLQTVNEIKIMGVCPTFKGFSIVFSEAVRLNYNGKLGFRYEGRSCLSASRRVWAAPMVLEIYNPAIAEAVAADICILESTREGTLSSS